MRNRLLVLVGAFVICLLSLNVASLQAQSSTVTTSATFSDMLSTFPQAVLSTINSVVLQSTNASSATTPLDSTARKDNLALQLGMWWSSRAGIGMKYWLSELTALRIDVNFGTGIGVNSSGRFSSVKSVAQYNRDSTSSNNFADGQDFSPRGNPWVTVDLGASASIEKHLFSKRNLSPFIGFGISINASSKNYTTLWGSSEVLRDTNGSGLYNNGGYIDPNTSLKRNIANQSIITQTSVSLAANVFAGVEYFVLPFISISAQASVSGDVTGSFMFEGYYRQTQSTTKTNQINSYSPSTTNTRNGSESNNNLGVNVSVGAGFSSSLTLSLYFGRNVLGDIVNAFTSGTLFQW